MGPSEVCAEVRLDGRAEPDLVEAVHQAVEELCRRVDEIADVDRMAFETAVVEIATNLVRHTVPVRDGVRVGVALRVTSSALEAEFVDDGAEVDVDLNPPEPDELTASGRGLLLVQRFVHRLDYLRQDDHNVWRLSRSLSS